MGTASYYWESAFDATFGHPVALPTPQPGGRMTLLADGRVMLVGGYLDNGTTYPSRTTVQIWTPATNSWAAAAPMGTARTYAFVTTLKDGRVLVAGGNGTAANNTQPLSSAEIWDPATESWAPAASMGTGRNSPSGVLLK